MNKKNLDKLYGWKTYDLPATWKLRLQWRPQINWNQITLSMTSRNNIMNLPTGFLKNNRVNYKNHQKSYLTWSWHNPFRIFRDDSPILISHDSRIPLLYLPNVFIISHYIYIHYHYISSPLIPVYPHESPPAIPIYCNLHWLLVRSITDHSYWSSVNPNLAIVNRGTALKYTQIYSY